MSKLGAFLLVAAVLLGLSGCDKHAPTYDSNTGPITVRNTWERYECYLVTVEQDRDHALLTYGFQGQVPSIWQGMHGVIYYKYDPELSASNCPYHALQVVRVP